MNSEDDMSMPGPERSDSPNLARAGDDETGKWITDNLSEIRAVLAEETGIVAAAKKKFEAAAAWVNAVGQLLPCCTCRKKIQAASSRSSKIASDGSSVRHS